MTMPADGRRVPSESGNEDAPSFKRATAGEAGNIIDALEKVVDDVKLGDAPLVITRLASVQSRIAARLMTSRTAPAVLEERLTLAEVAERLRMGTSTVRALVASGEFREAEHFARKGRRLLFFWSAVDAWLRQTSTIVDPPEAAIPFVRRGRRHG